MSSAQVTLYGREREATHRDTKNPWVQGSVPKWSGLGCFFVRHFEFLWNERHDTKAQTLDSQLDCMAEINQKLQWLRVLWVINDKNSICHPVESSRLLKPKQI